MFACWVQVEYMIVRFDHAHKKVRLSLRGEDICKELQEKEKKKAKK